MNYTRETIEKMRAMAKLKYVLKSVLKDRVGRNHQNGLDLSIVRTPDGGITETDQETHRATFLGFEEVFNIPEIHSEGLHTTEEWERCMQQAELLLQQTEYTMVPVDLKQRVYDALSNVPGRDRVERDIATAFETAPTYNEFRATLRDAKTTLPQE